jgi:hypothetical protein
MPERANPRVQYSFESFSGVWIAEDQAGQFSSVKPAVGIDDVGTKGLLNFIESRLARLDNLPGELIRIDDWQAAGEHELRTGGFAHADPTGKTKDLHRKSEGRRPKAERNLRAGETANFAPGSCFWTVWKEVSFFGADSSGKPRIAPDGSG